MPRRKKRRSAWGSIAQVDATTYRIRWWGKSADGTYRRMSETVRGTRKDAERRRAELMLLHSEDAPCPTVAQAWERWALPTYERRVDDGELAPRSLKQYQSAWSAHVAPRWADVPCDAVRPLHVQQWIDTLGRSQATSATRLLSAILDHAVRYEVVGHNPMRERYLMPSASTVERRDAGIWTAAQLLERWDALRGSWMEPAFILAAFGGLRVGESLGVRACRVHDASAAVPCAVVEVAEQVENRGGPTERLKTASSARVAAIVGPPAARLLGLAAQVDDAWFLTHDGAGAHSPQSRLLAAWQRGGAEHPFRNLRNSWQTWMRYDLRAPRWLIERLMGHVAGDVSEMYYDRPDAARLAEMMRDLYAERPIWDEDGQR